MRRSSNRVNEILHAVTKRVSAHERGDQTYASLYRRTRTEAADARDVEPASMAPRRQAGDQSREASAAYAIEAPRPAGVILNASRCDEAGARTGDPNHRRHPWRRSPPVCGHLPPLRGDGADDATDSASRTRTTRGASADSPSERELPRLQARPSCSHTSSVQRRQTVARGGDGRPTGHILLCMGPLPKPQYMICAARCALGTSSGGTRWPMSLAARCSASGHVAGGFFTWRSS